MEIKEMFDNITSANEFCNNYEAFLKSIRCRLYNNVYKESLHDEIKKKSNFNSVLVYNNITINCSKLIILSQFEKEYIETLKYIVKSEEKKLDMSCKSIKSRGFGSSISNATGKEKKYSLAFARNIYRSYEITELLLLAQYSKNNHYCYTVDSKFPDILEKMKKLEECLPNVYVTKKLYEFNRYGKYHSIGHYECMKILIKKKWDYLFLLQMDDVAIKTNLEMLTILEVMNFATIIHFTDKREKLEKKVDFKLSWKYKDLNIFLKGDKRKNDLRIMNKTIQFKTGKVPIGMRYDTVDYIVNKINITKFLIQLNSDYYEHDKVTWQTLLTDDVLNITNSIPRNCTNKYYQNEFYLIRKTIPPKKFCRGEFVENQYCVLNFYFLKAFRRFPQFFAYRFVENKDFGGFKCWINYMYYRNKVEKYNQLNLWYYYNLPQTQLQKLIKKGDFHLINSCKMK
uniref:Glycosyltransferase family 92 protein n=1 Tax=Strongyloides stercoralis TaxID=6248 RepID=A0A0K0EIU5_STRER